VSITLPLYALGVQDLGTVLSATSVSAAQLTADQNNNGFRGIKVFTNATVVGTSVTVTLQGKDSVSGQYYTLLAGAAIVAPGTQVLTLFPGAAVTSNVSANDFLPAVWRLSVAVTGTCSFTIGAVVM